MLTEHLYLDLLDRKVKVRAPMEITFGRRQVTFTNHIIQVVMTNVGGRLIVMIDGLSFLVNGFHVSYESYPWVRQALK